MINFKEIIREAIDVKLASQILQRKITKKTRWTKVVKANANDINNDMQPTWDAEARSTNTDGRGWDNA